MIASRIVPISCLSLRSADAVGSADGNAIDMGLEMSPRQMYEAVLAIREHVSAETWHAWTLRIAAEFAA